MLFKDSIIIQLMIYFFYIVYRKKKIETQYLQ